MADDIYHILGSAIDLWKFPKRGDNEFVDATEFWVDHAKNKVKGEGVKAKSLLARFVWVEANADDHSISLADSVQHDIFDKFGLKLANKYFKTFLSGIAPLPRVSNGNLDRRSYAFCFGPKRAAIWSHTRRKDDMAQPVTEGFLFLRSQKFKTLEDKEKGGTALQFRKLIEAAPWHPDVVRSSAFPAYLNALVLSKEISERLHDIGVDVRSIESRTGYHRFESRDKPAVPSGETLGEVSARASGHATKLAAVSRKSKMLERLLDFSIKMIEEDKLHLTSLGQAANGPKVDDKGLFEANVGVLRQRLEMQTAETEYALSRVQAQIEALFNLISQNDNINNLELSVWTKNISLTSQRDAASMKTLAVVTMFFLPGSFISALFSTPLFTWDDVDTSRTNSIGVGTTPQFGLYWAVTVPLTVITFILYFLWLWWQHRQRTKNEKQFDITDASMAKRMVSGTTRAQWAEKDLMQARRDTVVTEENSMPMTATSTWRNVPKKDTFESV